MKKSRTNGETILVAVASPPSQRNLIIMKTGDDLEQGWPVFFDRGPNLKFFSGDMFFKISYNFCEVCTDFVQICLGLNGLNSLLF